MEWSAVVLTSWAIVCMALVTECGKLNDYILDYQPLTYDRSAVHRNHERVRRSTDSLLKIRFKAYGRNFQLELSPAEGIFHPDHQVFTQDKGLHYVDTSFIYEGKIKGEPRSSVHVSIINGSIEGHVELPETRYHIEPAAKYLQDPAFHTIIYPETHMDKDPYRARREAERGSCAVDHLREWMETASQPVETPKQLHKRSVSSERESQPHNIYSRTANQGENPWAANARVKRQSSPGLGQNNTCSLHMRADPLLFQFFRDTKRGQISPDEAKEDILAFFASHVKAISKIYSETNFQTYNRDKSYPGLSFNIIRTSIMDRCDGSTVRNDYCSNTLDVSNYLDLTSRENSDDFCLTFTFTYRDFSGGTLGLAWVATESNVQSGVCGRHTTFTGGVRKSLNTGIVTIINFGKTVPNRVSQLTFAHEAGHNFGSPHDVGSDLCAPFGTSRPDANQGNYIMFPSATSGDKPHNDDFSPCSKDNITRIIDQVVTGARYRCFSQSGAAYCGNKITEEGEECDCGFTDDCAGNTCCTARVENGDNTDACQLKNNKNCSTDSGVCCDSDCNFVAANTKECARDTDCANASFCSGKSFQCPEPRHKPNGTFCNDYSKVCESGECIAPICSIMPGWEECFLVSGDDGVSDADLCFVACKNPTTGKCVSSNNKQARDDAVEFKNVLRRAAAGKKGISEDKVADKDLAIKLAPGSACDNFRGYCDAFSKCERIDAQGPFNQLADMIFDPVNLEKVKDWIVEHWWAVLLMGVGLVVFMGVFIKVFGYNTPSENPKNKRRRQAQERQARQAAKQNAPNNKQQGRPLPQPGGASAPPYHTGMDMHDYGRGSYPSSQNQYDRVNSSYGGHSYSGFGNKF